VGLLGSELLGLAAVRAEGEEQIGNENAGVVGDGQETSVLLAGLAQVAEGEVPRFRQEGEALALRRGRIAVSLT
jgi:hypothetical protein